MTPPDRVIDVDVGDGKRFRSDREGIWLVRTVKGGDVRTLVHVGAIPVKERVDVEGQTVYVMEDGRPFGFQQIVEWRKGQACIFDKYNFPDALSAVIHETTKHNVRTAQGAVAVYSGDDGALRLDVEPYAALDTRQKATNDLALAISYMSTPRPRAEAAADIAAYLRLLDFWHPFEILPTMGLSIIAPFAFILRQNNKMAPAVWCFGESDLGKSVTHLAFSSHFFGRKEIGYSSVDSEFRLAAHLDAAGTTLAVEEAGGLEERTVGTWLKEKMERPDAGQRGTKELGMVRLLSRSVLLFSSNTLTWKGEAVLKRILAVRFDAGCKLERRANRTALADACKALRPIGLALAEDLALEFKTVDNLLAAVEGAEATLRTFHDFPTGPKRAEAWAVVYTGLISWQRIAERYGLTWRAPDPETFVQQVVLPIEATTFEGKDVPVLAFARWLETWMATQVDAHGLAKGHGSLFVDPAECGGLKGVWVTAPLIDLYNRNQTVPDLRIGAFGELARSAADAYGLTREDAAGSDGRGRFIKIGGVTKRCAFIAYAPPLAVDILQSEAE